METPLRILFVREGEAWVSQCLEYDLNGQGSTMLEAFLSLARVIEGTRELDLHFRREPFSELRPAPQEFFDRFERAWRLDAPSLAAQAQRLSELREARIEA